MPDLYDQDADPHGRGDRLRPTLDPLLEVSAELGLGWPGDPGPDGTLTEPPARRHVPTYEDGRIVRSIGDVRAQVSDRLHRLSGEERDIFTDQVWCRAGVRGRAATGMDELRRAGFTDSHARGLYLEAFGLVARAVAYLYPAGHRLDVVATYSCGPDESLAWAVRVTALLPVDGFA